MRQAVLNDRPHLPDPAQFSQTRLRHSSQGIEGYVARQRLDSEGAEGFEQVFAGLFEPRHVKVDGSLVSRERGVFAEKPPTALDPGEHLLGRTGVDGVRRPQAGPLAEQTLFSGRRLRRFGLSRLEAALSGMEVGLRLGELGDFIGVFTKFVGDAVRHFDGAFVGSGEGGRIRGRGAGLSALRGGRRLAEPRPPDEAPLRLPSITAGMEIVQAGQGAGGFAATEGRAADLDLAAGVEHGLAHRFDGGGGVGQPGLPGVDGGDGRQRRAGQAGDIARPGKGGKIFAQVGQGSREFLQAGRHEALDLR